jgi:hypothetical protein
LAEAPLQPSLDQTQPEEAIEFLKRRRNHDLASPNTFVLLNKQSRAVTLLYYLLI